MIPLLQVRKIAARTLFLIPQVFPRGWGDSHRWSRSMNLCFHGGRRRRWWELSRGSLCGGKDGGARLEKRGPPGTVGSFRSERSQKHRVSHIMFSALISLSLVHALFCFLSSFT